MKPAAFLAEYPGRLCLLLILTAAVIPISCSTEFNVNAPFVERPIIWGLLDAKDSLHYLRIQRTFQTDGPAENGAADPEKIHYPAGALEVELQELVEGSISRSWFARRVDGNLIDRVKDDGLFATNPNVLYEIDAQLLQELDYRLMVRHLESEKEYEAETSLVGDFDSFFPIQPDFAIDFADTGKFKVQWLSAEMGFLYDAWYELGYVEYEPGGSDTSYEAARYPMFQNVTFSAGEPFTILETNITNLGFYTGLSRVLEEPEGTRVRDFRSLHINFGAGGENLYLLYLNSLANLGITELFISPYYTNIDGGALGILGSRSTVRSAPVLLTPSTLDSLACGRFTEDLGFLASNGSSCP